MGSKKIIDIISRGMEALGLPFGQKEQEKTVAFYELLVFWNRTINLTTVDDEEGFAVIHFLDSILYAKGLPPEFERLQFLDVGTGAGFPAIPLKIIFPDLKMFLVEPSYKKTSFLHTLNSRLNLKLSIVEDKVGRWLKKNPETVVDLVLMRAVGNLKLFMAELYDHISSGGRIVVSTGPEKIDLNEGGRFRMEMLSLTIPTSQNRRNLLIFHKT